MYVCMYVCIEERFLFNIMNSLSEDHAMELSSNVHLYNSSNSNSSNVHHIQYNTPYY